MSALGTRTAVKLRALARGETDEVRRKACDRADRGEAAVSVDLEGGDAISGAVSGVEELTAEADGRVLLSLEAPDFALPDSSGRMHSLSEYRGRKVLLVTWASW